MAEITPVRILIADDHPIFRGGLRRLLESQPGFHVVGEAGDGTQAVTLTKQLKPDILLLDVAMPGVSGIETLRQIARESIAVRTILLTAGVQKTQVVEAFRLGAQGFVVKGSEIDMLLKGIRAVMAGEFWIGHERMADVIEYLRSDTSHVPPEPENRFGLTARELEIISEILAGSPNKEIASKLSISTETVKRHLSNIYDKLGVSNRLELALFATSHKLTQS